MRRFRVGQEVVLGEIPSQTAPRSDVLRRVLDQDDRDAADDEHERLRQLDDCCRHGCWVHGARERQTL
jgi:hypothetical protein